MLIKAVSSIHPQVQKVTEHAGFVKYVHQIVPLLEKPCHEGSTPPSVSILCDAGIYSPVCKHLSGQLHVGVSLENSHAMPDNGCLPLRSGGRPPRVTAC